MCVCVLGARTALPREGANPEGERQTPRSSLGLAGFWGLSGSGPPFLPLWEYCYGNKEPSTEGLAVLTYRGT